MTNMQPAKEFRAAREAIRLDQQSWTSFVVCFCWWTNFFLFL